MNVNMGSSIKKRMPSCYSQKEGIKRKLKKKVANSAS